MTMYDSTMDRKWFMMVMMIISMSMVMSLVGGIPAPTLPTSTTSPYRTTTAAQHFLNILGPPSLTGSLAYAPATFGTTFTQTGVNVDGVPYFSAELVLPHIDDDPRGCLDDTLRTRNELNETFSGKFLMIRRGQCAFDLKASRAVAAGAAGVVVYGCPTTAPTNCDGGLQTMSGELFIPAPAIFFATADGFLLYDYLRERNSLRSSGQALNATYSSILTFEVIATTALNSTERAALEAIANRSQMDPDAVSGNYGGLAPWTKEYFANSTNDPCTNNRLAGVWCEGGHIVEINMNQVGWSDISTDGTALNYLGQLTQLRYLDIGLNNFQGPIPTEWCTLTSLQFFYVYSQNTGNFDGFTSFPACLSELISLKEVAANNNAFINLPDFYQSPHLYLIDVSSNLITTFPPNFSTWGKQLTYLAAPYNQFTTLPPVQGWTNLNTLSLASNVITSILTPTSFDNCSSLNSLDISSNAISGVLPNFFGCPALKTLLVQSNQIASSVPHDWALPANLPNLQTFKASHNLLVSPVTSLVMLFQLVTIELDYNRLTTSTGEPSQDGDLGAFLSSLAGPSAVSLTLDYNLLTGTWTPGWLYLATQLRTLSMAHNLITEIPQDLVYLPMTTVDFSYNNISMWGGTDAPSSSFIYLNLLNNPLLQPDTLPSWIVVGDQMMSNPGENFNCPVLTSVTSKVMKLLVDSSFSKYNRCQCAKGTFGTPPLCHSVPLIAQLNDLGQFSSAEIGADFDNLVLASGVRQAGTNPNSTSGLDLSFTDKWYGEDRLTLGISTSWVVDYSNQTIDPNPIRFITIRFHISRTLFKEVTDVLTIYEGGASLSGTRVAILRGTDTLPETNSSDVTSSLAYQSQYGAELASLNFNATALWEVRIFSNQATVSFSSRSQTGPYFFATYTSSDTCPDGYFFDPEVNRCREDLALFQLSAGTRIAVYATSSLAMVFVLLNVVMVCWYWNHAIIRATSRAFLLLTLAFLFLLSGGALLYAGVPQLTSVGDALCVARGWLSAWPLTGVLAVLLAKTNRVSSIFTTKSLQVRKVTDTMLLGWVAGLLSIVSIFLIVYARLPLTRAQAREGSGSLAGQLVYSCSNESGFGPWVGVLLAYIFCLILAAALLAFKTRNIPSRFNESAHIMNAVFLLLFYGILIVPLDFFVQDQPNSAVLIQGVGQGFAAILLTAAIFLPKMYLLLSQVRELDQKSMLTAGTTANLESAFQEVTPNGKSLLRAATQSPRSPQQGGGVGSVTISDDKRPPSSTTTGKKFTWPVGASSGMTPKSNYPQHQRTNSNSIPTTIQMTSLSPTSQHQSQAHSTHHGPKSSISINGITMHAMNKKSDGSEPVITLSSITTPTADPPAADLPRPSSASSSRRGPINIHLSSNSPQPIREMMGETAVTNARQPKTTLGATIQTALTNARQPECAVVTTVSTSVCGGKGCTTTSGSESSTVTDGLILDQATRQILIDLLTSSLPPSNSPSSSTSVAGGLSSASSSSETYPSAVLSSDQIRQRQSILQSLLQSTTSINSPPPYPVNQSSEVPSTDIESPVLDAATVEIAPATSITNNPLALPHASPATDMVDTNSISDSVESPSGSGPNQ